MQISIEIISILFLVAFVASTLDAIAGGGGLLTLPAILMTGFDPVHALGTTKLQASVGSIAATATYARRGLLQWKSQWPIVLPAFLGGAIGAMLANQIPKEALQIAVPLLLICVALYFYFSPKLSDEARKAKMSVIVFQLTIIPLIGFYDGIFGPGAGSFFTIAFVGLMGSGVLYAIAHTKLANTASNLGALLVFSLHGVVVLQVAIPMAIGALLGAQVGARIAIRYGSKLIKPLIIVISLVMAFKLLLDPANPIMQYLTQ